MPEPTIRVLIADDHPVVREGLTMLVSSLPDIEVVGTASSGEECVRAAVELQPDVVLMDLSMPQLGGVEATARIRRSAPEVKVLILTTHEDPTSITGSLRAGASGYLLKTSGIGEIANAIRAAHSGQLTFSSDIAQTTIGLLIRDEGQEPRVFPELTEREFAILDLLASGATTDRIAQRLGISGKTVSNNLSVIFTKLRVSTRTEAALLASSQGLGRPA
jgi:DNA-binding NarL/FixJ family response regulator